MGLPNEVNSALIGAANQGGYTIDNSLRFRDGGARLSRSFGSAGSRTTWTYSVWIKYPLNSDHHAVIMSAGTVSSYDNIRISTSGHTPSNRFSWYAPSASYQRSTRVARDISGWYHWVCTWDTTNGTALNRRRMYINGERITDFYDNSNPSSSAQSIINNNVTHYIGSLITQGTGECLDGMLAEVQFVDGTAYEPTAFAETNDDGVWVPKKFTGAYGGNGFYLDFSDTSSIGADRSGNGNNFSDTGFNFTSSSTDYDQMADTPTNNHAVLNRIQPTNAGRNNTTHEANLQYNHDNDMTTTTLLDTALGGKYYAELTTISNPGSGNIQFGIFNHSTNQWKDGRGRGDTSSSWVYKSDGNKRNNGSNSSYGSNWTSNGNTVSLLLDLDNKTLAFYTNGTSNGNAYTGLPDGRYTINVAATGGTYTAGFNPGSRPFQYSIPSGYVALASADAPEVSVTNPGEYFNVVSWSGNSSSRSITGVGFQPDLVWVKAYDINGADHGWVDSSRGATKVLRSNVANAEYTQSDSLTSFDSDGFSLGSDTSGGPSGNFNLSGRNFVGFCWKKAPGIFDIVRYSGTSSAQNISHSLGVVPTFMIVKCENATASWQVYFAVNGNQKAMFLDQDSAGNGGDNTRWNGTTPTSSVFTVGTDGGMNGSGRNFVAYLFADVPGMQSFGKYTGNANSDGAFINLGFKPALLIYKVENGGTDNWFVYNNVRDTYNPSYRALRADTAINEKTTSTDIPIDICSNGFKIRFSGTAGNGSGRDYVYMAWAESAFSGSNVAPAPAH